LAGTTTKLRRKNHEFKTHRLLSGKQNGDKNGVNMTLRKNFTLFFTAIFAMAFFIIFNKDSFAADCTGTFYNQYYECNVDIKDWELLDWKEFDVTYNMHPNNMDNISCPIPFSFKKLNKPSTHVFKCRQSYSGGHICNYHGPCSTEVMLFAPIYDQEKVCKQILDKWKKLLE
jgi:hypothetical protein